MNPITKPALSVLDLLLFALGVTVSGALTNSPYTEVFIINIAFLSLLALLIATFIKGE